MIIFLLSGLWHGANWTYVLWGGLNGIFQIIGAQLKPVRDFFTNLLHINRENFSHRFYKTVITFCLFTFSCIFFRSDTITMALQIIHSIITIQNPSILLNGQLYQCGLDSRNFSVMLFSIVLLFLADLFKYRGIKMREVIAKQSMLFQCFVIAISIILILLFGIWGSGYNESNFIYFQF